MKNLTFFFLLFIIFLSPFSSLKAKKKPVLIIYDLTYKSNAFDTQKIHMLSDRIRIIATKSAAYQLLNSEEVKNHIRGYLKESEFSDGVLCDEEKCMEKVASDLGAGVILAGKIEKYGEMITLNLYLKNMITNKITRGSAGDCTKCTMNELITLAEKVTSECLGIKFKKSNIIKIENNSKEIVTFITNKKDHYFSELKDSTNNITLGVFSAIKLIIPLSQVILLLALSTFALLFGKVRIALLINYLFSLYWGYTCNKEYLKTDSELNIYIYFYFTFGILIAVLAVIGFIKSNNNN